MLKNSFIRSFKKKNIQILRSELVIFELSAKGAQLVNNGKLPYEDLTKGLLTLTFHPEIIVIPIYYSEIQISAIDFHKDHSDFIDCLMLSSALHNADFLLTLDKQLVKKFSENWKNKRKKINQDFEVVLWKDRKKIGIS